MKSGSVDGEKVKGDMDFDVVLCQSELTERALQLCHLLPPGFLPVGLNSYHRSHAQPCVSLSGCLIELNSHSSGPTAHVFGRERVRGSVCIVHLSMSVRWDLEYVLRQTDFSGPRISARAFSLSLCPPFDLMILLFVFIARSSFLPHFSLKNTCFTPAGSFLFCSGSSLQHT